VPRSTAPPPPAPWYRRIAPRYLALIAAGVLVLGAGGVYAAGQLGSEDEPAPRPTEPAERAPQPSEPVNPGTVTVSVLNGTSVTGLARQIGDDLESRGFQIGNVTNATAEGGERAESAALYVGGARREARAVARALDISQIEAASPEIEQLAGGASVIVVVGLDKTQ
jgi:predicted alpha/beta-fold hydrolase